MRPEAPLLVALLVAGGCDGRLPGRPRPSDVVVRPSQELDFAVLYGSNCAGCHGREGRHGASVELGNPVYLGFATDAVLQSATANGVPGTAMPAFAQSAGGMLTDAQVQALVHGMRAHWGKPEVLRGADAPPYAAALGDAARGAEAFSVFCAGCHGREGRGGAKGSNIVAGTYLALVSAQHLRTTVLVGLPGLGAPDWRTDVPGRPMSAAEVSDVVAWLWAQRVPVPGQPDARGSGGAEGMQ